eukprot:13662855-Alexandrium_andersonii.AAC.1
MPRARASGVEFEATRSLGLQGRAGNRSGIRAAQPAPGRQSGYSSTSRTGTISQRLICSTTFCSG